MPLRSSRSFSGKLIKRYKSKTKLKEEPEASIPSLPLSLPAVDIGTSLNLSPSPTGLSPPQAKGLHRRSRSFSQLLSYASVDTTSSGLAAPGQPWRDREVWAAIHSPSQGPVRSRKEGGSVMDRSYGWMERIPASERGSSEMTRRDREGREGFKFFHNIQNTSEPSFDRDQGRVDDHRPRGIHSGKGRSRLNQSHTTADGGYRPTSENDTSSTISSMDLSTNPHTPPTSIDQHHFPSHSFDQTPNSATSVYSTEEVDNDLPLPPLLPHNVKRADTPPAFTSRYQTQIPWAQRSTMRDVREASNLRWATPTNDSESSPVGVSAKEGIPRTPEPVRARHGRKRSTTLPSISQDHDSHNPSSSPVGDKGRPESGLVPPSPPRPARHPKRQTRAPPPIPVPQPGVYAYSPLPHPPRSSSSNWTPPSSREDEFNTPLSSPMIQSPSTGSPSKSPSAYNKPVMPLRSIASQQGLKSRPGTLRPSTAPTPGSPAKEQGLSPGNSSRLARNTSASSATRGGWI